MDAQQNTKTSSNQNLSLVTQFYTGVCTLARRRKRNRISLKIGMSFGKQEKLLEICCFILILGAQNVNKALDQLNFKYWKDQTGQKAILAFLLSAHFHVFSTPHFCVCRPIKQKRLNLPQLLFKTYLRLSTFLPFVQKIYRKSYLRENF